MRLRRIARLRPRDQRPQQRPPPRDAFVDNIEQNGLLHEADLLPDSYGGKFHPRAVPELVRSLPAILKALQRGKVTPKKALLHQHKAPTSRSGGSSTTSTTRTSATSSTSTSWAKRTSRSPTTRSSAAGAHCPLRGARTSEGRVLARLREPRLHAGAARLDGAGRPAARHRARRARPRLVLRRRRDRRAQPGARRHAQRAHVRARPAGDRRRRRADDEHLLDLPGRADRVPGAPRRQHRVPRPHQRDARARGPDLRARASRTRTSSG